MTIGETSGHRATERTTAPLPLPDTDLPGSHVGGWARRVSPVLPPALALIEMAVLAAVVLAEYFWEGFPSLTRINPHPYWIAILLLSLQYGTVSGLLAAGLAIVGTVLIGMPEPDIEERYFNYLIRVWTQPVLWLLTAMLLGSFRARQIEQRDELLLQAENLRMRGATLLDYATNLRTRCTMLERRIAMRETADTGQLLSALSRLGEGEQGRWAAAYNAVLDAGFPKSQISLYAIDGGSARLITTPRQMGAPAPAEIDAGHPLFAAVVGAARPLCVIDPDDDGALRGIGVAAVPVFSDEPAGTPRVIGLLKADLLPPAQIDASTTRRLSVVAAYLAPVLQRRQLSPVSLSTDAVSAVVPDVEAGAPPLRRWRLLKVFQGGRSAAAARPEAKDV